MFQMSQKLLLLIVVSHLVHNFAPHMKLDDTTHKCFSSFMICDAFCTSPATRNKQKSTTSHHTYSHSDHERKQIIYLTLQQHVLLSFILNSWTVGCRHIAHDFYAGNDDHFCVLAYKSQ